MRMKINPLRIAITASMMLCVHGVHAATKAIAYLPKCPAGTEKILREAGYDGIVSKSLSAAPVTGIERFVLVGTPREIAKAAKNAAVRGYAGLALEGEASTASAESFREAFKLYPSMKLLNFGDFPKGAMAALPSGTVLHDFGKPGETLDPDASDYERTATLRRRLALARVAEADEEKCRVSFRVGFAIPAGNAAIPMIRHAGCAARCADEYVCMVAKSMKDACGADAKDAIAAAKDPLAYARRKIAEMKSGGAYTNLAVGAKVISGRDRWCRKEGKMRREKDLFLYDGINAGALSVSIPVKQGEMYYIAASSDRPDRVRIRADWHLEGRWSRRTPRREAQFTSPNRAETVVTVEAAADTLLLQMYATLKEDEKMTVSDVEICRIDCGGNK